MKWSLLRNILFVMIVALLPARGTAQQLRHVPDSTANQIRSHSDYRYANDPSMWKREEPRDNTWFLKLIRFLSSPGMRIFWYALLAALIILILYQVVVVNGFFLLPGLRRKRTDDSMADEEIVPADLNASLDNAIAKGEYRLAIRFLYLKTLNHLSDNNRIRLHAKLTNNDYLNQMRRYPGFDEFSHLTRVYEYVWYGEYLPKPEQFERIHQSFNKFTSAN